MIIGLPRTSDGVQPVGRVAPRCSAVPHLHHAPRLWPVPLPTFIAVLLLATACAPGGPKIPTSPGNPGATGAIEVLVSGLPAATDARVTLTATTGAATEVTGSTVVTQLPVGSYAVSAGYVTAEGQQWTPVVSRSNVVVSADDTVAVQISYTASGVSPLNLVIAGVQLIQSTQRADGTVPMVAGRDALLRVFVTANQSNTTRPAVRVRLFQGGTQVDSFTITAQAAGVPINVDTAALTLSWNVVIPGARVVSGLAFQAEVDPDDAVAEQVNGDNRWPLAGGTRSVTVQSVPGWNLLLVPVRQSINNLTGAVSAANKDAIAEPTRRMFPLGAVAVAVRPVFTTSAPEMDASDTSGAWSRILSELFALRTADGSSHHYVGIARVNYSSGIAGLGYIGAPTSLSWDKSSSVGGVVTHEVGHNFGRAHAPCGNPGSPDVRYPYPNASIGTWGLDLPAASLKLASVHKDVMSYCGPNWVSDYTYLGVLEYRGPSPAVSAEAPSAIAQAQSEGLLVWGRILNGRVVLEPAFLVHAPPRLPGRPGRHRIEGLDATGGRLFSLSFDGEVVADLPGGEERHFAYVLPLTGAERQRLTTLRLTGNGLTGTLSSRAALRDGPDHATPTEGTRIGGDVEVRWDRRYPLAVLRDRTGIIVGFGRGGVTRVTVPAGGLAVSLSHGVSSLPSITVLEP